MKLYLNSYFYDFDHPYGIIIYEIEKDELGNFFLLNNMCNELIKSEKKIINNRTFKCDQIKLAQEIIMLNKDVKPLATDRGWKEYCDLKFDDNDVKNILDWVVIELSINKGLVYNDFFWDENINNYLKD